MIRSLPFPLLPIISPRPYLSSSLCTIIPGVSFSSTTINHNYYRSVLPSGYPSSASSSSSSVIFSKRGSRLYNYPRYLPYSSSVHTSSPLSLITIPRRNASNNNSNNRFFDRLIPEDDPQTKEFKERERRVIKEQFQRGKFADAMKARTEKLYIAPPHVMLPIPENLFPNDLQLESILSNDTPKNNNNNPASRSFIQTNNFLPHTFFQSAAVTIVTIAFQGHGQEQLVPWHEGIRQAYGALPTVTDGTSSSNLPSNLTSVVGLPNIQMLNILYLQGWFFKIFRNIIKKGTARSIDNDLLTASRIIFEPSLQKSDHFCDKLKIHNRMMGYIYLIDQQGYIRWRAHALPAPSEMDNMIQAVKLLAPK